MSVDWTITKHTMANSWTSILIFIVIWQHVPDPRALRANLIFFWECGISVPANTFDDVGSFARRVCHCFVFRGVVEMKSGGEPVQHRRGL